MKEETNQMIVIFSPDEKQKIKDNSEDISLFTKWENFLYGKYSPKPLFRDLNSVLKNNKKRKKDMDNITTKIRGKISKRVLKILKYKLKNIHLKNLSKWK